MNCLTQSEILNWRKEFPILNEKIHLANCSQSPQSLRVRQAIDEYLNSWRYDGMDWNSWMTKTNEAKIQFANLINADPTEISVTMSVSDATTAVFSALPKNENRNKIVTTMIEFPTIGQILLAHNHLHPTFVPANNYNIDPEIYTQYVDKHTSLLCTAHVGYQNGYKQDIAKLAKLAHSQGAWIYVDAYQSLGTEPVDVKKMDIDFLSSGALKYLLGIPGIAFLYVKKEIANQLYPKTTGWFGQQDPFSFIVNKLDYAEGTRRFDTGTPPIIAAYAAAEGMKIINEVGVRRINEHVIKLKQKILAGCHELNLTVLSPSDPYQSGAAIAIAVDNSHDVEHQLYQHNVIISARGPVVRLAPHFFTIPEEIDRALPMIKNSINN